MGQCCQIIFGQSDICVLHFSILVTKCYKVHKLSLSTKIYSELAEWKVKLWEIHDTVTFPPRGLRSNTSFKTSEIKMRSREVPDILLCFSTDTKDLKLKGGGNGNISPLSGEIIDFKNLIYWLWLKNEKWLCEKNSKAMSRTPSKCGP